MTKLNNDFIKKGGTERMEVMITNMNKPEDGDITAYVFNPDKDPKDPIFSIKRITPLEGETFTLPAGGDIMVKQK